MKQYAGEEFLNKIYQDLVNSDIVKHTARGTNKNEDVHIYMDRLNEITKNAINHKKMTLLKQMYYDKYIIKQKNVPESYFEFLEKVALERGYGHVKYGNEQKREEIKTIISEQKASLDKWIDYFAGPDTEMYPTWFKYFCFQGMIKLGHFNKENGKFTKRTDSTVKPFIELNREAISFTYSELMKLLNKEKIDDQDLEKLLQSGSFAKIYAYAIKKINSIKKVNSNSDEGVWKKYNQGSDPNILFNDIHGKGTGWCTAGGIETAESHINGGDFYVYYTKDENGEFTNPRIAIRMNGQNKIAEIRGVAYGQNIESNMESVIDKKLEEFPDKDNYKKKVKDMEFLTYIYTKSKNSLDLSIDELKFLYQIDNKVLGFGYDEDPRLEEIIASRNIKEDLALIFNCSIDQISLTKNEALSGNIIFHYGDLYFDELTDNDQEIILPKIIMGNLDLRNLTKANNIKFPIKVCGSLNLKNLKNPEGVKLPEDVRGNLLLSNLKNAKGLTLPKSVEYLDLDSLEDASDLVLPLHIEKDIYLSKIKTLDGLIFPEKTCGIFLENLVSAKNVKFPNVVNGSINMKNLKIIENTKLPDIVMDGLFLNSIQDSKNLKLPNIVKGFINLDSLERIDGLKMPSELGGITLSKLKNAEGLLLPSTFKGDLWLNGLENVNGLKFPQELHSIHLDKLKSAEGLILSNIVHGTVSLASLKCAKGVVFPKIIHGDLNLQGLLNDDGLVLPDVVEKNLYLFGMLKVKNLKLPQQLGSVALWYLDEADSIEFPKIINGNINLCRLRSVKNMTLPQKVSGKLDLSNLRYFDNIIIPDELKCETECIIANNDIEKLKEICKLNNKKNTNFRFMLNKIKGLISNEKNKNRIRGK